MSEYIPDEFKELHQVILNLTGVDVFENKRKFRKIVNSKMVYSKILRSQGFTYSKISNSLKLNHASVIYYVKSANELLQVDKELKHLFDSVTLSYKSNYLKHTKEEANIENLALKAEIEMLKVEIKKLNEPKRLGSIIKLLRDNLPVGKEKKMELAIKKVLNGLR